MTQRFWGPPALVLLGGLALLVATGSGWVTVEQSRDIGGVALSEPVSTAGTAFAPLGMAGGLVVLVLGGLLAVLRGAARRMAGALTVAVGVALLAVVVAGVVTALGEPGTVTAGPWAAAVATALVIAAGVAALRRPAAPAPTSRYRVGDEQSTDDEWEIAAREQD